ncbi:MAG: hypothetical protein HY902_16415 [Deltaproteobacteria bacterium]|nr:hypothetical protein [Deltaproteobacteria bacterium]
MLGKWWIRIVVVVLGTLLAGTAQAGRRPHTWVWDAEVLPERGVEVESWVTDRIYKKGADITEVWLAPIVGLTDRLELAMPLQWSHAQAGNRVGIDWYGAELRWRLRSPDPIESGGWSPLLRAAVRKSLASRDALVGELTLVGSWDATEKLRLTANVGALADAAGRKVQLQYAAGISYVVMPDLRLGVEVFSVDFAKAPATAKGGTLVGPSLGWTHGRLWTTAGYVLGITEFAADGMFRLMWGIAI